MTSYSIGEIAERYHTTVATLRYYDESGFCLLYTSDAADE